MLKQYIYCKRKSDGHLICVIHPPYVLAQLFCVCPCPTIINNQQDCRILFKNTKKDIQKLAWIAFLHHFVEGFLKKFKGEKPALSISPDAIFVKQRCFQIRKCLLAHSVNFGLNVHSVCANFDFNAYSLCHSIILFKNTEHQYIIDALALSTHPDYNTR